MRYRYWMSDARLFHQLPTNRVCGSCDLCCTAVAVDGLPTYKPAGTRCPHLSGAPGASCSIYKDRPYECAEFACFWRSSNYLLPKEMYPADCGFVISPTCALGQHPMIICIHPDPERPDAWKEPRWKPTFFKLARAFNAIVVVGHKAAAIHIFSPRGNEFSRLLYPDFFRPTTIGLPGDEFLQPYGVGKATVAQLVCGLLRP